MAKRRRGAGAVPRRHKKKLLYLILDDDPFGYSIRQISLLPPTSRQMRSSRKNASASGKCPVRRLPYPIFLLEARRGLPSTFAAIGTKIVGTQCMDPSSGRNFIPIYDVRRRSVTFGPGMFYCTPIYIPVGDKLFALDTRTLSKLSFEPKQPPALDSVRLPDAVPWSWQHLPPPPFHRMDVNSYAVHPDGQTILVSTDSWPDDPYSAAVTFTFDTSKCEWKTHGEWTLPFTGQAYFVHSLDAFVGLSKDPATLGHLTSCNCLAATSSAPTWKLGKENLFSDDPDETHVSARLVHTGRGCSNEFCLVQCVSVKPGNGDADLEGHRYRYRYRLTTFSLSYNDNGDLTTGKTSWVQCYEVPNGITQRFIDIGEPVAFWM